MLYQAAMESVSVTAAAVLIKNLEFDANKIQEAGFYSYEKKEC